MVRVVAYKRFRSNERWLLFVRRGPACSQARRRSRRGTRLTARNDVERSPVEKSEVRLLRERPSFLGLFVEYRSRSITCFTYIDPMRGMQKREYLFGI